MNAENVENNNEKKIVDPLGMISGQPENKTVTPVNEAVSKEKEVVALTQKELSNLRKNKYESIKNKFEKTFMIQNKKTKQIVELNAATDYHACKIVGWRPKNCIVIGPEEETKDNEKNGKENVPEETTKQA